MSSFFGALGVFYVQFPRKPAFDCLSLPKKDDISTTFPRHFHDIFFYAPTAPKVMQGGGVWSIDL